MDNRLLKTIERIKQKRIEKGLSYQDLSILTGFSKSVLQRYETGAVKKISLDRLEIIANALSVSPEWLMGWETDDKFVNSDSLDKQLSEIEFALSGEIHDLSDNEKQDVLDYIRFKKQQKEKKNDPDGSV